VGKARIGLAISDFHGILASPLATVSRTDNLTETLQDILQLATEQGELLEIYIGAPINLQGDVTLSTQDSIEVATEFEKLSDLAVLLIDERLTTAVANNQLKQIGKSQKDARATIDQMAAVAILEFALSVESRTGSIPGLPVEQWRAKYE
jgi:putative Holliday junction resolvase